MKLIGSSICIEMASLNYCGLLMDESYAGL
ncbi:hypothetical protein SAMN05216218_12430 [Halorientalis regularis]|uniref:Uncharacterized protein n=1 Tax=Halorientalis regularis TaxID=660518 RepID=A0A1G7TDC8_9EURY|nr:hypothetical protein SAMN05216218_12430 [Halorientalis regularis]